MLLIVGISCAMRNNYKQNPRYFIKSLGKGLKVLQSLGEANSPLSLSKIAASIGTDKTTATRLCYTLTELGFIHRDVQKQYHLSPKVLTLGTAVISGLDWLELCRYYLERLFEEMQKTVNFSVLEGDEILYLIRIRKEKYLPFDIRMGTKLPLHCTAMGKVLLALGDPEKTGPIIEKLDLRQFTPRTITDRKQFMEELNNVKTKGYAINDEELTTLARSVAAPILNDQGYAVAAINIASPTTKCSLKEMVEIFPPRLIEVAREMSAALLQTQAPIVVS